MQPTILYAIETRFVGPTDRRGSRILVTCDKDRRYRAYDHSLSAEENHRHAAVWFAQHLREVGDRLVTGATPRGYVHVIFVRDDDPR